MLPRSISILLAAWACAALLACARAESEATNVALLSLDKVLSGPMVAERNVTVAYTVHNVGSEPATNVVLKDLSFPASRFTLDQPARAEWPELAAGASVEHFVVLSPRRAGELFVSPASVAYHDGERKRVSRLAAEDSFHVEDLVSFRRKHDTHMSTWTVYAVALLLFGLTPFAVSHRIAASLLQLATPPAKKT